MFLSISSETSSIVTFDFINVYIYIIYIYNIYIIYIYIYYTYNMYITTSPIFMMTQILINI